MGRSSGVARGGKDAMYQPPIDQHRCGDILSISFSFDRFNDTHIFCLIKLHQKIKYCLYRKRIGQETRKEKLLNKEVKR